MAKNPANAGSIAIIGDPEVWGPIKSVRQGDEDKQTGVGLGVPGISPDVVSGRSGGHRSRIEAVSTIGQITFEGDKATVEGSVEGLSLGEYFNKRTLGILRTFAERLSDEAEARHYNQVLTELAEALKVDEQTKQEYDRAFEELESRGNTATAESVFSFHRDQLRKTFQVIEGYVDERPLSSLPQVEQQARVQQERALLLYSEFVLACVRVNSIHSEAQQAGHAFLENRLNQAMEDLGISEGQKRDLTEAFTAMTNFADFSYLQTFKKAIDYLDTYQPPDDSDARARGGVALEEEAVERHLRDANAQMEGAHRLLIASLDRINEPARQRWIEAREQNPEVDISSAKGPFSDWQSRIEARITEREGSPRSMQSGDYINGILGSRKEEGGIFGKHPHKLQHHIKNVTHKAPVKRPDESRDKLEEVQAAEIAIIAGIWQGEWNQGATAKSGESHSKEFYQRVVDVTVWSVTLNSADAVVNFLDQLEAADAMQMHGEVVGEVIGNQADVPNAQAFRIPVLNHRGEPSFLVVDRETYYQMIKVARTSQESYAKLAQKDDRYKVHSKEKRHKAFKPQLKESRAVPEAWVNQERDFILAEEVSSGRINALKATGSEVDGYVAKQLEVALENYRRQLNEFQMNFCREPRYRQLAIGRLVARGIAENSPDFKDLLPKEMNAVAWEYANKWNAFKSVTTRLLELQSIRNGKPDAQLDADNIKAAEDDLLNFLANLDYELEIQTRATSTGHTVEELRSALQPFMRTVEPPSRNGLLLKNAYQDIVEGIRTDGFTPQAVLESSYALARLVSEKSSLSRRAKTIQQEQVTTLAGQDESVDVDMRYDAIEARTVLESLQSLRIRAIRKDGSRTPLAQIDIYNEWVGEMLPRLNDVLSRTEGSGDLVFPDNSGDSAVEALLVQASARVHALFNRRLTPEEEVRFFEGGPGLILRRNSVLDTLEAIGQLRTVMMEVASYPAQLLNGRQLDNLTQQELVDYATLVYATVMTVNSLNEGSQLDRDKVRASYDRFIDEATGNSVTSGYIRRRVHERVAKVRGQSI